MRALARIALAVGRRLLARSRGYRAELAAWRAALADQRVRRERRVRS